jgi:hypothetical protein
MVSRQMLGELARRAPLLPGRDTLAFVDIDAMQKRVYGHRKQGAGFGHTKIQGKSLLVRGLNALAATICTPLGAPVIAATRLRGGTANSARGDLGLQDGRRRLVEVVVWLRRKPGHPPAFGPGQAGQAKPGGWADGDWVTSWGGMCGRGGQVQIAGAVSGSSRSGELDGPARAL